MAQIDNPASILAKDRSEYYKASKKEKDNYERQVKELEDNYEKHDKKRDANYSKQLNEIRDRYESQYDKLKENHNQSLADKKEKIQAQLSKEKESNSGTVRNLEKDHYEKLENLNESYNENLNREKSLHDNEVNNLRSSYMDSVKNMRKASADQMGQVQERFGNSVDKQKVDIIDEKNKMQSAFEKRLNDTTLSEQERRNQLQKHHQIYMDQMSKHHNLDKDLSTQMNDAKIQDLRQENNMKLQKSALKEKLDNEKLVKNFNNEFLTQQEQNEQNLKDVKFDHLAEKRLKDYKDARAKEMSEKMSSSGIGGTRNEIDLQNRVKNLEGRSNLLQERLANEEKDFATNLKDHNALSKQEQGKALMKKDLENQGRITDISTMEKNKNLKLTETLTEKNRIDTQELNAQLAKSEKDFKTRLRNLNENFGEQMQDVNTKNAQLVDGLKKEHIMDKRNYAASIDRIYNDRQVELMKSFDQRMSLQSQVYENRIQKLEENNEKLRETLRDSISRLKEKNDQELITNKNLADEQKNNIETTLHDKMSMQEKELMRTSKEKYERLYKKLQQQENDFQKSLKNIVFDYESKIQTLNQEKNKNQAQSKLEIQRDRREILAGFNVEKQRIIEQYENMLENIKKTHEEEMNNLRNFRQMSQVKGDASEVS